MHNSKISLERKTDSKEAAKRIMVSFALLMHKRNDQMCYILNNIERSIVFAFKNAVLTLEANEAKDAVK